MGMSLGNKPHKGVAPEMNVTPLVDVVLVLLIIFMVVMPQMDKNIPVDLPGVFHPDPEAENRMDPVEITLSKDGTLTIDRDAFTLDQIEGQLVATHSSEPTRRVVIRADSSSNFIAVREVFGIVKKAGFTGASLMVSELGTAENKKGERHGP